ncbi:helix-turn-helix domain-containing protein [Mucilaginibacter sp. CAU 1740]
MKDGRDKNEHEVFVPHRDFHYMLVVLINGYIKFKVDFEDITLAHGAILLIQPGQVHHILDFNEPNGWVIEFDPALVDKELQYALIQVFNRLQPVPNDDVLFGKVQSIVNLMEAVQIQPHPKKTLFHLLMACLSIIINSNPAVSDLRNSNSRPYAIQQSFSELLSLHYKQWKQPSQYALSLSISMAHLNDTVKALTGLSVSDHIQEFSVLNAKRLLFLTDLSIKEIGYEMGYSEPVYFGKLFKKVAGTSPLQFRRKYRDEDY